MTIDHSLDVREHNLQSSDLVAHYTAISALPAGSRSSYRTAKYTNFCQEISTNTILVALPLLSVEQNDIIFLNFCLETLKISPMFSAFALLQVKAFTLLRMFGPTQTQFCRIIE